MLWGVKRVFPLLTVSGSEARSVCVQCTVEKTTQECMIQDKRKKMSPLLAGGVVSGQAVCSSTAEVLHSEGAPTQ